MPTFAKAAFAAKNLLESHAELHPLEDPAKSLKAHFGTLLFGVVFYVTIAVTVWGNKSELGQALVAKWPLGIWTPATAALFLVLTAMLGSLAFGNMRAWLRETASRQGFLLTFLGAPTLLGLVMGLVLMPPQWQVRSIRLGFILVATLLPAIMYYLFIVTRKGSLLSEFLSNAGRLGVLANTDEYWRPRAQSYFQKFEAAYGPIPKQVQQSILDGEFRKDNHLLATPLVTVFVSEAAVPVLAATFLIALMWATTLPPILLVPGPGETVWNVALRPELTPVTCAFLGAYYLSLQFLFRRYVRKDLRPSVYVGIVLRIVVSLIGIWVLVRVPELLSLPAEGNHFLVVGFVIGVFPRVALQVLAALFKAIIPAAVLPSLKSELPISDLHGLTLWHETRLEDEDIDNVPTMASADLLELMINTRFPGNRIVDWVDQAILYSALGPEDRKATSSLKSQLAAHGIHTASGLIEAFHHADARGKAQEFAQILGRDGHDPQVTLRSLIDNIETSPNMEEIRLWRELPTLDPVQPNVSQHQLATPAAALGQAAQ